MLTRNNSLGGAETSGDLLVSVRKYLEIKIITWARNIYYLYSNDPVVCQIGVDARAVSTCGLGSTALSFY
jgi:hypothetical protein